MPNLNFLIGRPPVIIPHGILPAEFQPQEGSVYESFAPGLPPVIHINGQFYPLTVEEINFLKQEFAQSSGSSNGPEGIPQMPSMPTNFEQIDDLRKFEQKQEQAVEKKQEQVEQPPQQSKPQQPTTSVGQTSSVPQPLISVEELISHGKDFVSQDTIDDFWQKFRRGQAKAKANPGSDASGWLKLVLLKAMKKYYQQKKQ